MTEPKVTREFIEDEIKYSENCALLPPPWSDHERVLWLMRAQAFRLALTALADDAVTVEGYMRPKCASGEFTYAGNLIVRESPLVGSTDVPVTVTIRKRTDPKAGMTGADRRSEA